MAGHLRILLIAALVAISVTSGKGTDAAAGSAQSPAPTLVRLEANARALGKLAETESPTIRELYRRVKHLIEAGRPADTFGVIWFESDKQRTRALNAIRGIDDPVGLFLLIPGESPKGHLARRPVRRGSLFAGVARDGTLYCASPRRPEPRPC